MTLQKLIDEMTVVSYTIYVNDMRISLKELHILSDLIAGRLEYDPRIHSYILRVGRLLFPEETQHVFTGYPLWQLPFYKYLRLPFVG